MRYVTPKNVLRAYNLYRQAKPYVPYIKAAYRKAVKLYKGYKGKSSSSMKSHVSKKSGSMIRDAESRESGRNNIGVEPGHEGKLHFGSKKHKRKTKKAVKKAKRQKKRLLRAFKKIQFYRMGFMHRYEGINTVTDAGTVYMTATTNPSHMVRYALGWALLRTLFRKAKINITDLNEVPRLGTDGAFTATTQDFMLEIVRTDVANSATYYDNYQLPGSAYIGSLIGLPGATAIHTDGTWTDYHNMIGNLIGNSSSGAGNLFIYDKVNLYARDNLSAIGVLAPVWNLVTSLDLDSTIFYFKSIVNMKIQNRTNSQDTTSNAESVSASPLEGKVYYCNNGCPKLRDLELQNSVGYFMVDDLHGNRKFGASAFSSTSIMGRVPPKNIFKNCKQAKKVYLSPGAIEAISFSYEMKGKLKDIVAKQTMRVYQPGGAGTIIWENRNAGKSIVIALEDVVNVGAQSISVAYEINRWIGCYCVENKKKLLSKGALYTATTET